MNRFEEALSNARMIPYAKLSAWDRMIVDQRRKVTERIMVEEKARIESAERELAMRRQTVVYSADPTPLAKYAAAERERIRKELGGGGDSILARVAHWFKVS